MLRAVPELPEVETIRRGLQPHLVGRVIEAVVVRETRLRWPVPDRLTTVLVGRRVDGIERRGKYLLIAVGDDRLLIHLGMSGRLWVLPAETAPVKHDHLDLKLSGGVLVRFHDPRRFGCVLLIPKTAVERHPLLSSLGPEPFDAGFSGAYLYRRSRGRRVPIKSFLMDHHTVVGVGNIYASEVLFRARLRPGTAAGRISRPAYERLCRAVRETLSEAIAQGGTTVRDFAGAHGEAGYFQQTLMVYGRAGAPCRICASAVRQRVIGQRSSFFCPICQR